MPSIDYDHNGTDDHNYGTDDDNNGGDNHHHYSTASNNNDVASYHNNNEGYDNNDCPACNYNEYGGTVYDDHTCTNDSAQHPTVHRGRV